MKNKEKKVIILDNLASPFISQAIIILKEGAEYDNDNIIKEAEKIVAGYFPNSKKNPPKKNRQFLFGGIFAALIVVAAVLIRLF